MHNKCHPSPVEWKSPNIAALENDEHGRHHWGDGGMCAPGSKFWEDIPQKYQFLKKILSIFVKIVRFSNISQTKCLKSEENLECGVVVITDFETPSFHKLSI